MIANERQYRSTRRQVEELEQAVTAARSSRPRAGVDPRVHAAMVAGIEGELDQLRRQLLRYERLKAGAITTRGLNGLADLPEALIEARIARNWSHRELAQALGMHEQQVQRHEQQRYAKASLATIVRVADTLGMELHPRVRFGGRDAA
jgi:HTH-type transcriptional regulator/antitoxin HigA